MRLYWRLALLLSFLFYASCEDTAAEDIGPHMIMRISQLLTPRQCQDFYQRIKRPEADLNKLINSLSEPEKGLRRRRREIVTTEQCKEALKQWIETQGETAYWDHISTALTMVGRSDMARELERNMNEDKLLELRKYVESYHESAKNLKSPLILHENDIEGLSRIEKDLTGFDEEDWELIVEREQLPPYTRSPTAWVLPLVNGILIGFIGGGVLAGLMLLMAYWFTRMDNSHTTFDYTLYDKLYPSD